MLTGDNEATALAVAAELGIEPDNVVAGVLPQEKADFVNKLKERRRADKPWYALNAKEKRSIVAFCGDGFNDTAALAAADVGSVHSLRLAFATMVSQSIFQGGARPWIPGHNLSGFFRPSISNEHPYFYVHPA